MDEDSNAHLFLFDGACFEIIYAYMGKIISHNPNRASSSTSAHSHQGKLMKNEFNVITQID